MNEPTRCRRCGRALRAERTVAAGVGRRCGVLERQATVVLDVSPAVVAKAREDLSDGAVVATGHVTTDGSKIYRVVSSDGDRVYTTASSFCRCPAGIAGRTCRHRVAVLLLEAA